MTSPSSPNQDFRVIFDECLKTRSLIKSNIFLMVDGYHFYKNARQLRDRVFSNIQRNTEISLATNGREIVVPLIDLPGLSLVLHDLVGPSEAQLRDVGFVLVREAFNKMEEALAKEYSAKLNTHCVTRHQLVNLCITVSRGLAPLGSLDTITHILDPYIPARLAR